MCYHVLIACETNGGVCPMACENFIDVTPLLMKSYYTYDTRKIRFFIWNSPYLS